MGRSKRGATLGLVIASMLVLIAIGAAVFILLEMLGGGRQTLSATDAGVLNVATTAMLAPAIDLSATANPVSPVRNKYADVCDSVTQYLGTSKVNLLNFNKVVFWGLQVALNAYADAQSPDHNASDTAAMANAKEVWNAIEGDTATSISSELHKALWDPNKTITDNNGKQITDWGFTSFKTVANANSVQMANPASSSSNQVITMGVKTWRPGYLGVGDSSNVPFTTMTNIMPYIDLHNGIKLNSKAGQQAVDAGGNLLWQKDASGNILKDPSGNPVPVTNGVTIPSTSGADGNTYVQGYKPITVPQVGNFYFVPVYPDQTPSLRSDQEYQTSVNAGEPAADAVLPPNAIHIEAETLLASDNNMQNMNGAVTHAQACVGAKAYPLVGGPTGQYVIVDNGPAAGTGTGPTLTYDGNLPILDNVTAQELATAITAVGTGSTDSSGNPTALFSNATDSSSGNDLLTAWHNYYSDNSQPKPATIEQIFNQTGAQASTQDMQLLQNNVSTSQLVACTDLNSDSLVTDTGNNALVPTCNKLLLNGGGPAPSGSNCPNNILGAFDAAFFGQGTSYGLPSTAPNLSADEYSAVAVAAGYASGMSDIAGQVKQHWGKGSCGCAAYYNLNYSQNASGYSSATSAWTAPFNMVQSPVTSGLRLFYPLHDVMRGACDPWCGTTGQIDANGKAESGQTGVDSSAFFWAYGGIPTDFKKISAQYSDAAYFGKVTVDGSMDQLILQNTTGLQNNLDGSSLSGQNVYVLDPAAGGDFSQTGQAATSSLDYSRTAVSATSISAGSPPSQGQQPIDEFTRLLTNRIYQINPAASSNDVSKILSTLLNQAIPPAVYYIYYDFGQKAVVCTTDAPPAYNNNTANKHSATPDGDNVAFSTTFPLIAPSVSSFGRMMNAHYYDALHDGLFMNFVNSATTAASEVDGTHTVLYESGSGKNLCLGEVQFRDQVGDVNGTFSGRN